MKNKQKKEKKKETITIKKKTLWAIAPAIPIIAILLSKRQPGPLLLFLIGIVIGIFIGREFFCSRG